MISWVAAIEFDPLAPEQRESPYAVYADARDRAPVFYAERFGFWVVTRYEDVLTVLKDRETYTSRDALTSSPVELPGEVEAVLAEGWPEMPVIIDTDPPLHTRIRGLVTRAFTPRRVAEMELRIAAIAATLLDDFAADGRADIVERFAWPLPLTRHGRHARLARETTSTACTNGATTGFASNSLAPRSRSSSPWRGTSSPCSATSWTLCASAMRRRATTSPARCWPSRAEIDPPLPLEVVIGVPFDLIVAGHVTVTRAIGNGIGAPALRARTDRRAPRATRARARRDRRGPPARVAGAGPLPKDHQSSGASAA